MIAETTTEPKRAGFETEEVQVISTFPQTVVLNSVANVYRSQ